MKHEPKQKSIKQCTEDKNLYEDVLSYYKESGRHDLLWRKKITPYRILVSEIMLQQTQVTRVLSKFEEWMKHYPTLSALSKSTLQEVLILWQGLGYQRRAKALLTIAKTTKRIPKTFNELCELQGVGTYTASAISAFAYNTFNHPVLETNIRTVLLEYFYQNKEDIHDDALYQDLYRLESYNEIKELGARKWYYALMDYGAYLKLNKISHNAKSAHYTRQAKYKGSFRELRAKTLFAITHGQDIPEDTRVKEVLKELTQEGYIIKVGDSYTIS